MDDVSLNITGKTSFNVKPHHLTENQKDFRAPVLDLIKEALPQIDAPLGHAAQHHFIDTGKMLRAGLALSTAKKLNIDAKTAVHWAPLLK